MRTVFIACLMIYGVLMGLPAAAGELLDISVVQRDTRAVLDNYSHRGQIYIAGQPNQRYAVALVNRTGERILVVLSVDGINAITGETASPQQTGYVLDPYQQVEILGWRKSERDIAQFYFTTLPNSYAARTQRPNNVGVIGVAVFREKALPPPPVVSPQLGGRESANAAEAAPSRMTERAPAKRSERIGTGHGAREYAPVSHTDFIRASKNPQEIITLRYESPERLIEMGILPRPQREPQPFPQHYVPDPPR